ncbi:hypothetical protein M434DRAFT_28913 [Hypoxylon sp. CO27-5]|nr:hypothetical protein M434DRAFT_28913 [Hypoxylon sp. CO27-5]
MSDKECHQPIGFVCCHCRYRSSGSFCSNPDRLDCPHRNLPRCKECPILFTPSRSGNSQPNEMTSETEMAGQGTIPGQERNHSVDSETSDQSSSDSSRSSGEQTWRDREEEKGR